MYRACKTIQDLYEMVIDEWAKGYNEQFEDWMPLTDEECIKILRGKVVYYRFKSKPMHTYRTLIKKISYEAGQLKVCFSNQLGANIKRLVIWDLSKAFEELEFKRNKHDEWQPFGVLEE